MQQDTFSELISSRRALWCFCLLFKFALFLLSGSRYGYLSDELYFLDAARHAQFGYVDFPPMIAWLAGGIGFFGNDSISTLRFFSMLFGFGTTVLSVEICRTLGGRGLAQWITALTVMLAPGFVAIQSLFTMNVLDQFWWLLSTWLLLKYLQVGDARYMIGTGLVLGLGILTKLSILALCAAAPAGLLAWYPAVLKRREFGLAVAFAIFISMPFWTWQIANGLPTLEFMQAYGSREPAAMVLQIPLLGLLITANPVYALFWAPGSIAAFFTANRPLRFSVTVAWLCLGVFAIAGVKFYFALPAFAIFIAAGAIFWEQCLRGRRILQVVAICLALSGIAGVPSAAPVLPKEKLQAIANFLRDGQQGYPGEEPAEIEPYFPHFAEMHGWPELVATTTRALAQLPPAERESVTLFAAHFGQAGALNILDSADELPVAYSGHMSHHLWNADVEFRQMLFVGFERGDLATMFGQVREVAVLNCERCMSREQGLKIHYAADPTIAPEQIRQRLKRYYFF